MASPDPIRRPSLMELRDIAQLVDEDLAKVEDVFEEEVRSDIPLVGEIARYIREGGGKRIRPALLLLAGRACGQRGGERAILLASVVEFIHTATLLHDDIIDGATVRRGRRSVNSRWGNDITVLLGDFLYTKAMSMALSQDNLRILRLLSDVTLRMVEGQLLEIEHDRDLDVTPDEHIDIMKRKTAYLFSASTRIGAMLAELGEEKEEALARYGLNLGICFQMIDDLLDFTAKEEVLGKPVASDLREGKLTLPAIFMVKRGGREAREKVSVLMEDGAFTRVSREELLRLARDTGALEEARRLAVEYAEIARTDLAVLERSKYREALAYLPDFILSRDR
jgi:octaprenyl-diphosphate synthase